MPRRFSIHDGPTSRDAELVFDTLFNFHDRCTPAELRELETMYRITHESHRLRTDNHTNLDVNVPRYECLVAPLRQRLHDIRTNLARRKIPVTGTHRTPDFKIWAENNEFAKNSLPHRNQWRERQQRVVVVGRV